MKQIVLDINYFDHLLKCMSLQRGIADMDSITRDRYQQIIDKTLTDAMLLLQEAKSMEEPKGILQVKDKK